MKKRGLQRMKLKTDIHGAVQSDALGLTLNEAANLEVFLTKGTEDAFGHVCSWLSPRLMRYFRIRGCEPAVAEELTQDVLFTVFRYAATIRDRSLFRGWVYTVARNSLLQRWRKGRRNVDMVDIESVGQNTLAARVEPSIADTAFTDLVACLSAEEREILTLRFVEELEYREIALALEIPVGTAKWRVFNSKLKLALQLRKGVK